MTMENPHMCPVVSVHFTQGPLLFFPLRKSQAAGARGERRAGNQPGRTESHGKLWKSSLFPWIFVILI